MTLSDDSQRSVGAVYEAFISYRRVEPDRQIARELHRCLERFRTPAPLVRRGFRPRLAPVFLDEQELEAGSLSDKLRAALRSSGYLMIVCSAQTRESLWIADEIREFLETHPATRLLFLTSEPDLAACLPAGIGFGGGDPGLLQAATLRVDSRRRSGPRLSAETQTRILAAVLPCDLALLTQAIARQSRVRRAWSWLAGGIVAALTSWLVISLNLETTWHADRSPLRGLEAGFFLAPRVLDENRLLTRSAAGELQVLEVRHASPAAHRTLSGPGEQVTDRWGAVSPGGGRQLFALKDAQGASRVRALEVETGKWFPTPAWARSDDVVEAAFAGTDDDVFSFPDPADASMVTVTSLEGRSPDIRFAGLSGSIPWDPIETNPAQNTAQNERWWILSAGVWISRRLDAFLGPTAEGKHRKLGLWTASRPELLRKALIAAPDAEMLVFAAHEASRRVAILEGELPSRIVLSVWALPSGHLEISRELVGWPIFDVAFSQDGRHLLVSGERFVVFRTDTLQVELDSRDAGWILLYPGGSGRTLEPVRKNRSMPKLLLAEPGGGAQLWDPESPGHPLASIAGIDLGDHLDPAGDSAIAVDRALDRLLFRKGQLVELWSIREGRRAWNASIGATDSYGFSTDENAVTVISPTGELQLMDSVTGATLTGLSNAGSVVYFDRGCRRVWMRTGFEDIRLTYGQQLFGLFRPLEPCD